MSTPRGQGPRAGSPGDRRRGGGPPPARIDAPHPPGLGRTAPRLSPPPAPSSALFPPLHLVSCSPEPPLTSSAISPESNTLCEYIDSPAGLTCLLKDRASFVLPSAAHRACLVISAAHRQELKKPNVIWSRCGTQPVG